MYEWREAIGLLSFPTDSVGRFLLAPKALGVPDWEVVWAMNGNVMSEGGHVFSSEELERSLYCGVYVPPMVLREYAA